MNNAASTNINFHRKLIDIPDDVFGALSIRAASMGLSLKKYIENLLMQEADEMDDAEVYKYLASNRPDGKVMLNEQEQDDFLRRHKLGAYR